MEGNEIKEGKIQEEITKHMTEDPMEARIHKVAHDCIQEGRFMHIIYSS